MNQNNQRSHILSSNDIFELLLLGTLYLFKTSLEKSFERQSAFLREFESASSFTPYALHSLSPTELNKLKKIPIIVEGIVESDSPIYFQSRDTNPQNPRIFPLISLYKFKAPFYFSFFNSSSTDYYKEATCKPELLGNMVPIARKTETFWLKDYHKTEKKLKIFNNSLDDKLCLEFLGLRKKHENLDFSRFFKLREYGHLSKYLGVKCGVFMGVYGDFQLKEDQTLQCLKPIRMFKSRRQVIEKLNEELSTPKTIKNVVTVSYYLAFGVWGFKKGWELARNYLN